MVQLKVGDKVKGFYYRDFTEQQGGFYLCYLPDMNSFIGKIGTVVEFLDTTRVALQFDNVRYWYPVHLIKLSYKIQNKLR